MKKLCTLAAAVAVSSVAVGCQHFNRLNFFRGDRCNESPVVMGAPMAVGCDPCSEMSGPVIVAPGPAVVAPPSTSGSLAPTDQAPTIPGPAENSNNGGQ